MTAIGTMTMPSLNSDSAVRILDILLDGSGPGGMLVDVHCTTNRWISGR